MRHWRTLVSDAGARFDREVVLDATTIEPQVTWGTSPEMVTTIEGRVPDPDKEKDPIRRENMERALAYMGLAPNTAMADIAIDKVFIGSCTNSRIEDLRAAAAVVRGRHKADSVKLVLVVPGSGPVKAQAEREGLDRIFTAAGFEWREPGCSMCLGMNDDRLGPASAARRPPTAISKAARVRAAVRTWSARRWRPRPRSPGISSTSVALDREAPMQPFRTLTGLVAPLDRANVDTDTIIPKQFLKSIARSGFGPNLFDAWRYLDRGEAGADAARRPLNPDFVLNQPRYQQAQILLARRNFGCGSSREHAPWALMDYGFRALIAPVVRRHLLHQLLQERPAADRARAKREVDQLFHEAAAFPGFKLCIDLERQTVSTVDGAKVFAFEVEAFRKHCLLNGLDEIGLTLQHADEIRTFEAKHLAKQPWLA